MWYDSYLHGVFGQGKAASEITFFGWVWPLGPLFQSDRRIVWPSLSLEGINRSFRLLLRDNHQVKVACETTSWLGVASYAFYPYQIEGFFDHQYWWIESSDLRFCLHGDNRQGKAVHVTAFILVGCGLCLSSDQIEWFFCGSVV